MRPRRLHLPIPLRLPAREFSYAARVFSGHCVAPAYLGSAIFADQDWFSPTCECSNPRGSSAHIIFDCPLWHIWAPGYVPPLSNHTFVRDFDHYFPGLFRSRLFTWRWYADHCLGTPGSLCDALALYALHHEELLPSILAFELERTLPASTPYYPVSMAPEHFLHRYLAAHEVQYVPKLGSHQPDHRPVVYVPPHFI
ncbi:hypothetical protein BOTBODRAFT_174087 [Botryobasidium botryosum FD-172 SS1]|uniref:Uncharacterized protein n=1 Tax=Botryobasidium botryosum (strain FD-172 SS1) TaxID=930990 RepID=A0A067MUH2_BOTB1|nr:hypothetical protein BOTBODRAFT_174087 [Botryobasidium botryosum FD-172 SS1]